MSVREIVRGFVRDYREVIIAWVVGTFFALVFTSYTMAETHIAADLAGLISIRLDIGQSAPVPRYALLFVMGWGIKGVVSLCIMLLFSIWSEDEEAER